MQTILVSLRRTKTQEKSKPSDSPAKKQASPHASEAHGDALTQALRRRRIRPIMPSTPNSNQAVDGSGTARTKAIANT